MARHKKERRFLPWNIRKHTWLNRWHYFTKPALLRKLGLRK